MQGEGELLYPPERSRNKRSKGQFAMALEHGQHEFEYKDGTIVKGNTYAGRFHGETFVFKKGEEARRSDRFPGVSRQRVNENLIFAGHVGENLKPSGWGSCYDVKKDRVWRCLFNKEGELGENAPYTTSYPRQGCQAMPQGMKVLGTSLVYGR